MSNDLISRKDLLTAIDDYCGEQTYLVFENVRELIAEKLEGQAKWHIVADGDMPPEHDSIFVKFKDTDKWNNAMFAKRSDEVNVTVEFEDGTRKTGTSYTMDGEWKVDKMKCLNEKVVAWMPLPEPYKAGGEE